MGFWQRLINPVGAILAESRVTEQSRALAAMRLSDPQGREIPTRPRRPDTNPIIAVRNEDLWSTYPSTGLTPAKLASLIKQADAGDIRRGVELAAEIETKSGRILSNMETRKRAVQKLEWTVTPASDDAQDEEIADFVRTELEEVGLHQPTYELLDAILKGFAAQWINWRYDGARLRLDSLEWLPQQRFTFIPRDFNPRAAAVQWPRMLTDKEQIYGEELQPWTSLIHRDRTRSTFAHQTGLWRTLVWYWMFGNFSIKDWVEFLDGYGVPFKLGKYPSGMDSGEIGVLKSAVQARGGAGAVINDQTLLEIIESKSTGTDMHERLARYCDEMISIVILGQTASTQGTPGKLGNEEEQGEVRKDRLEADAVDLAETYRYGLIWPLVGFNWGFDRALPGFAFTIAEAEDLKEKSETYKMLVEIGVPITVRQAQEEFGILPAEGDEPLLQAGNRQQATGNEATLAAILAAAGTAADPTPSTRQADRMEIEASPAWVALMDRIKELVASAPSLPALREALLAAYGGLPTEQLTEIMALGFAAADLAGRYDVEEGEA